MLCLKYEEILDASSGLIDRLHSFLGVRLRADDAMDQHIVNPSNKDAPEMPADVRDRLIAAYTGPNRRLAQLLGPEFKVWEY